MVHTVEIISYTPKSDKAGRLTFKLGGNTYNARCYADAALADGLLVVGTTYPVSLTVEAEGSVEYAVATEPSFNVVKADEAGDRVEATGRTWDSFDHQVIKLDSNPTVGVKINLPQTATDYRGGSWLKATGTLCADLPPEDHD
ncbi:MAG: hypothetical protein KDB68_09510 [Planctomycetes bacterium]|nr:hypothetical protein [Planctomycetota bacterium]MCA8936435.1 hypothetical protein [Planctomycetota bacterium]MCA8945550.1 hypothetical protein [Planctomycetota bacterium]